jgi:hypothetical protein
MLTTEPRYPEIPGLSAHRVRAIVARAIETGRIDERDADELTNAEVCELEVIVLQMRGDHGAS